ncbi:MAG: hypothetical protein Q4A70_01210 [Candidatus Saccharibacteria bacterium]|nr:hypothetical protein [Candidatus Saccharibacteria bacterium]
MKRNRTLLVLLPIVLTLVFGGIPVFAATCGGADTSILECEEGGGGAIWHILLLIINILAGGVGVLGLVGIMVFGVQFLTAGGDPGKTTKAKNRMIQILIGLVTFALLWTGLQWLLPGGVLKKTSSVKSISLKFETSTLAVNKTVKPLVEIDGEDKSYSLVSSDPNIVSAYAGGALRCIKEGGATITAIAVDGQKASADITCEQKETPNPFIVPDDGGDSGSGSAGSSGDDGDGGGDDGGDGGGGTARYDAVYELRSGRNYQYWINVPNNATSGMPLIVFLHGDGERGNPNSLKVSNTNVPMVKYLINGYNGSTPYLTLVPVLPTVSSKWTDSPSTLKTLIDGVVSEYNVDKNKINIVGFSRGATGLWKMVDSYPNYFAAAVPVSNYPQFGESPSNFLHTKIWAVAGEYETNSDWNVRDGMSNFVNRIRNVGGSAKMEVYPYQYHGSISGALRNSELVDWLLKQ